MDYFDLFSPKAEWTVAAKHVKVFKIYPTLIMSGSEKDLIRLFNDLKARNIALALEFGPLTDNDLCGRGIEGYGGELLGAVAKKIKRLGGDLLYLAMDEPLLYGAFYNGKRACHADIASIAKDAGRNIGLIKAVFPNIQIGDIEPVPQPQIADWNNKISTWVGAFERENGQKLAFFHADVIWSKPWEQFVSDLKVRLRTGGIPLGIIYNGRAIDSSDLQWASDTQTHYEALEAYVGLPDQAVFQSWDNHPTHVMPETEPDTMTGILRTYVFRFKEN